MKLPAATIILNLTTSITLLSLDSQAPGHMPEYGIALRAVVWIVILGNAILMGAGIRALAEQK